MNNNKRYYNNNDNNNNNSSTTATDDPVGEEPGIVGRRAPLLAVHPRVIVLPDLEVHALQQCRRPFFFFSFANYVFDALGRYLDHDAVRVVAVVHAVRLVVQLLLLRLEKLRLLVLVGLQHHRDRRPLLHGDHGAGRLCGEVDERGPRLLHPALQRVGGREVGLAGLHRRPLCRGTGAGAEATGGC